MSVSKLSTFTVPAKWFSDICGDGMNDIVDSVKDKPNYGNISFALELSDDSERVLSSVNDIYFMVNHYEDGRWIIEELVCSLIDDRWIELLIMNNIVMRETVKLFGFLLSPPLEVINQTKDLIICDKTCVNLLCDIWLCNDWKITDSVVYVLIHSPDAWKFIDRLIVNSSYCTSSQVIECIEKYKKIDPCMYKWVTKLIGKNKSCLEYLLNLDNVNSNGIVATIDTIKYYDLWDIVLSNGAVGPIVDFVLSDPSIIICELHSVETVRDWLIPRIEKNVILADYITLDDLSEYRFTDKIFQNVSTVDIILDWVTIEDSVEYLLDGLVSLATRAHPKSCKRVHDLLIDKECVGGEPLTNKLSEEQWDSLMKNESNYEFVESELKKLNKEDLWTEFMFDHKLTPYWVETNPDSSSWVLFNLNKYTVANISDDLYHDIILYPHLLNYDNWITLFQTRTGIEIGIKCISYVIETGVLFALFQSSLLSTAELIHLIIHTDTLDYCDEDDFIAISRRKDAYDIDFPLIKRTNKTINQEILTYWHDPDRIARMSNLTGFEFRDYLALM